MLTATGIVVQCFILQKNSTATLDHSYIYTCLPSLIYKLKINLTTLVIYHDSRVNSRIEFSHYSHGITICYYRPLKCRLIGEAVIRGVGRTYTLPLMAHDKLKINNNRGTLHLPHLHIPLPLPLFGGRMHKKMSQN